jgi:hypothetical protein
MDSEGDPAECGVPAEALDHAVDDEEGSGRWDGCWHVKQLPVSSYQLPAKR